MAAISTLLLPPRELSACLFAAIARDTRGVQLADQDRLNFFPASPLVSVTYVIDGEVRMAPAADLAAAHAAPPLPRLFVMPPQSEPIISWNPGPVRAIALGIYPDAWATLDRTCDLPGLLERAFAGRDDIHAGWTRFCAALAPAWQATQGDAVAPKWTGPSLSDWARALMTRAALSGVGRGARSVERRLKRWSGHSRNALAFYGAIENLHQLAVTANGTSLAELALAAGYADQSHMGRALRRATGFSPARLNQLIAIREAFWCYRLLGERF